MDALKALPPVTRTLLLATAACTVPVLLAVASVYPLVFIPHKIFGKMELWRLVTPFFYGGGGIPLVFDVFLLYRNSSDLEERHFQRRTADYAWALILVCSGIIGLNTPLRTPILFHPFLMALTHIWAQTNPTSQVSLFGLINMPAPYFPFALLGIDLVKGGPAFALQAFTGLAAAHAWYFLSEIYPGQNGGRRFGFLSPPTFLSNLLATATAPGGPAGGAPATYRTGGGYAFRARGGNVLGATPGSGGGVRDTGAPVAAAGTAAGSGSSAVRGGGSTGYRWGSGQRLGEQ